jgi:hypothetical protein
VPEAREVAAWPDGIFPDQLAALHDGTLAVSIPAEARIDGLAADGTRSVLFQSPEPVAGLVPMRDKLYASVGQPGRAGRGAVWQIDTARGLGGKVVAVEGCRSLAGLTCFLFRELIAADAELGRLYRVDVSRRKSTVWFQHELLLGGVSVVHRFGNHLFVGAMGRALLLRIEILPDGEPGSIDLLTEHAKVLGAATDVLGRAYLANAKGIERCSPGELCQLFAGTKEGIQEPQACTFGRGRYDRKTLYVTTVGAARGRLMAIDAEVEGDPSWKRSE